MKRILYTLTACLFLPLAQIPVLAQSHDKSKECWPDSIKFYQQQFDSFKESDLPTTKYMETAFALAFSCKEGQQYELGERVAAKALVRGSFLADSCWYASSLFSLLAHFYEQRGDTIMPKHFHRKSQTLGIKYAAYKETPDSAETIIKRLDYMMGLIDNTRSGFCHDRPAHLYFLNDLCWSVGLSGNTFESVYLGDMILQLANDHQLTETEGMCYAPYYWLLYFYPLTDAPDKAKELLPLSIAYYKRYPIYDVTEADLYANLGFGLMDAGCNEDALPYLLEARNRASQEMTSLIEQLDLKIQLCKNRN